MTNPDYSVRPKVSVGQDELSDKEAENYEIVCPMCDSCVKILEFEKHMAQEIADFLSKNNLQKSS